MQSAKRQSNASPKSLRALRVFVVKKNLCALCASVVNQNSLRPLCLSAKSKTQQYRALQPVDLVKITKKLGTSRGACEGLAGTPKGNAETTFHRPGLRDFPLYFNRPTPYTGWLFCRPVQHPRLADGVTISGGNMTARNTNTANGDQV